MVDVNVTVKVPGLEKLADYAASGLGSVAGSMLAPWAARQRAKAKLTDTRAEADSLRLIAQAQADAQKTLALDDSSKVSPSVTSEHISQRLEYQEQKRQHNIASAVGQAAAKLEGEEVSDHEPDHDWVARYFEYVQDISSEDVRKIWANILAGEVRSPGGVSLRTLSILRNMSHEEAELFAEAMRYRVGDFILKKFCLKASRLLNAHHLTFLFEDLGLFYSPINARPGTSIGTGNEDDVVLLNADTILFVEGPKNRLIVDDDMVVRLKSPAMELAQFCEATADPVYLGYFADDLAKKGCTLSAAPIISVLPNGDVTFKKPIQRIDPFTGP